VRLVVLVVLALLVVAAPGRYFSVHYEVVPAIGPLFPLNFAGAVVIGLGLLLPFVRLRVLRLLLALAGIALAGTSFVFLFVSEHRPLEVAQRSGAALLAEHAHEELIATGARPRRIVQTGAAALTPSERRIAAKAGEGLSNREIAQALFVTLRTVEMHLSNTFRKLGVSSRTQLPAALADEAAPLVTADA
jgi:DNA-binding CsgD family transcriptional regulator